MKSFLSLLACVALLPVVAPSVCAGDEIKTPKFLFSWGKKGSKPGEFYSPIGIAINKKDEVFVTDLNNARVQKFSADGEYLGGFDLPWDAPKRKSTILGGIALDDAGHIYLAFMNQHKLAVFDEKGKLLREWGKKGKGDGEFHQPGGIVLTPGNTLFVADQCNHRIQKFTRDGKFLAKWGEHGKKPGHFDGLEPRGSRFGGPHFLAMDSKSRFFTTEGAHGRVQMLTQDGKPLAAWGNKSDKPGGFGGYQFGNLKNTFGPIGVAIDRHDRVWVTSLNDRVQCFTPQGKYLFGIAEAGKKPGQFIHPHGMAFDSRNRLYVADAGNQRIQVLAIPQP
jgi:sugar lactone lactonase YvrE